MVTQLFDMTNDPPQLLNPDGIQFTVFGVPVPKGSTRAFFKKGMKYPAITAANAKTRSWAQEMASCAIEAMMGRGVMDGPIEVVSDFYFEKPKSKKKAIYKLTAPDTDKLLRNCLDSMIGIVFRDDAQVVITVSRKHYGSPARAEVQVRQLAV